MSDELQAKIAEAKQSMLNHFSNGNVPTLEKILTEHAGQYVYPLEGLPAHFASNVIVAVEQRAKKKKPGRGKLVASIVLEGHAFKSGEVYVVSFAGEETLIEVGNEFRTSPFTTNSFAYNLICDERLKIS